MVTSLYVLYFLAIAGDNVAIVNVTILNENGDDEYDGAKDPFEGAI